MDSKDLRSCNLQELTDYMRELGQPAYRARQLFHALQKLGVGSFLDISDIPLELRERLQAENPLPVPRLLKKQISAHQDTAKLLLELADGERVEMALMLYRRDKARDRATCCVSSQSGCAMACRFCASGMFGRLRNLSAGEIVSQAQLGDRLARELGFDGVSNIVYMGMGEPLMNPDAVRRSIELINDPKGMEIGARRITVSTCGIVPEIYRMTEWGLQVGLAVSLHSADEEQRRRMMPGAARWSIAELTAAAEYYQRTTGRRVTYEYALFAGLNDSDAAARALVDLLTESRILVNIIPANAVPERGIAPPSRERIEAFCRILEQGGINLQQREKRGGDIEAACGQLRRRADGASVCGQTETDSIAE